LTWLQNWQGSKDSKLVNDNDDYEVVLRNEINDEIIKVDK
jgi:hypothetical protein